MEPFTENSPLSQLDPAQNGGVLPRNINLKAFDPHRKDFTCRHEADTLPPIDPQAEAWLQEGLVLTNPSLWPKDRNYPAAVALWKKAAERKHWKAMMNLAGLLIEGAPQVPADPEQAIGLIEALMQIGVPAAFDAMGSYYQRGVVVARGVPGQVERGASRSYAFWELAAYMGSSEAQAVLGDKMNALYDNPKEGWWGNEEVALKMLECSYSQGNGKGAYRFGSEKTWAKDFSRGIAILHEGVKFGSERCANKLGVIFSGADIATGGPAADPARAARYNALANALYWNPDRRFPNLDKILPLPPAKLPQWDGDEETLINAAKAVVSAPLIQPTPGAKLTGRAHIPEGWRLPVKPVPPQMEAVGRPFPGVPEQYERTSAHFTLCASTMAGSMRHSCLGSRPE